MNKFNNDVVGLNTLVPVAGDKHRRYINLDNAATTPPFKTVLQTVNDFARGIARFIGATAIKPVEYQCLEEARRVVGSFFWGKSRRPCRHIWKKTLLKQSINCLTA